MNNTIFIVACIFCASLFANDAIFIELKSRWTSSNCGPSYDPVESRTAYIFRTPSTHQSANWTTWTNGIPTSKWNGAPWTCVSARLFSNDQNNLPEIAMETEYVYSFSTSATTNWAIPGQGWTNWSNRVISSKWNGGPYTTLRTQIKMPSNSMLQCRLKHESLYLYDGCSTQTDGMRVMTIYHNGAMSSSEWLITSEMNGAPWGCMRLTLECRDNLY